MYKFFLRDPSFEKELVKRFGPPLASIYEKGQVIWFVEEEMGFREYGDLEWIDPTPDWSEQWGGEKTILLKNGESLTLSPGPGFGDATHETTKLSLELLGENLHQTCIDIGCGSGILAIAAKKLGYGSVLAVDISLEAVLHTRENARLNEVTIECFTKLPDEPIDNPLIVMNMIASEQRLAREANQTLFNQPCTLIASGILVSDQKEYLDEMRSQGFTLLTKRRKKGWAAFVFRKL